MRKILSLVLALSLSGCGLFGTKPVKPNLPSPDSSTPPQYQPFNSGVLGVWTALDGRNYWMITPNLELAYQAKYKTSAHTWPFADQFGNHIFIMEQQELSIWHNDIFKGK